MKARCLLARATCPALLSHPCYTLAVVGCCARVYTPARAVSVALPDARPDVRGAQSASGSKGACAACAAPPVRAAVCGGRPEACAWQRAAAHGCVVCSESRAPLCLAAFRGRPVDSRDAHRVC
jgi:hypothetical protein